MFLMLFQAMVNLQFTKDHLRTMRMFFQEVPSHHQTILYLFQEVKIVKTKEIQENGHKVELAKRLMQFP